MDQPRNQSNELNKLIATGVIALVIGAVGGFWSGTLYQKTQVTTYPTGSGTTTSFGGTGQARQGFRTGTGGFAGRGGATGTIASVSSNGITITLANGSTKTVDFGSNTTVTQQSSATIADLAVGKTVQAIGTPNSDGSTTANRIIITG